MQIQSRYDYHRTLNNQLIDFSKSDLVTSHSKCCLDSYVTIHTKALKPEGILNELVNIKMIAKAL